AQFVATVAQLEAPSVRHSAADMIELVLQAVYEEYLQATFANYHARQEDVEQLAHYARQFTGLEDFLTQLALLTSVEAEAETKNQSDDERLRLSTIHQAKGLEFGVVFVIMLCDGLFPSARSLDSSEGEEEERRLFYVAVTRAKNELYLSYPLVRVTGASGADIFQQPSRFLNELPRELREEWNLQMSGRY
ncbi:MAG: 3'-5' exonuclease, partial [Limisphaerales bacterium]